MWRLSSQVSSGARGASARRLEGRLADLMLEIQMVREAVQNRPVDGFDEGVTEAPPSYANENGRAQ